MEVGRCRDCGEVFLAYEGKCPYCGGTIGRVRVPDRYSPSQVYALLTNTQKCLTVVERPFHSRRLEKEVVVDGLPYKR